MTDTAKADRLLQQGLFHHRQGQIEQAMERYVEVLQGDPENADALYYVAVVACQGGEFGEGVKLARRAISIGPPQARLHNLLGQALYRQGERLDAIKNFDQAIALDPNFADAHGNRANVLADAGFPDEALKSFDRALALKPDSATDWVNRGALLQSLGRHQEALASFQKAVASAPDLAEAHVNRGNALKDLGQFDAGAGKTDSTRFDEAEAAYNEAIKIDKTFDPTYLGRGLLRMLRGDWQRGFADYEHRSNVGTPTYTPLPDPMWDGEKRAGERVVLVSEQGLGDTIQFCRFAPLLAARGHDVTLLVRKAMAPLLADLPGVTIATDADELTKDKRPLRWLPLLSVPGVLGIRPTSVPATVPYLAAQPARVKAWRAKLGSGFKVGINWGPGHSNYNSTAKRDIPLAQFAPLAALPGVQLISLQKGPAATQIAEVPFGDRIMTLATDPDADADFFLDTAAVMMGLDLIVTCDTSVTHLAGALARPVFTAVPVIGDWRWLLGRDDSPWYPTLRLFRQEADGRWEPVFARIAEAVRDRAAQAGAKG
ncbi:MAG TPA: tetratricopeptide repeat-containing glycosyltransferase family protein [Pseudolabrys sp.]|nr:tetratricopeptide repeat-containing glycosyltransferase family protein [Pseudolabrys sp.]